MNQLADKMQMKEAIEESEVSVLDKEILEQFQREAEIDDAQREIEEAILLQSQREIEEQILNQSRKEYFDQLYKTYNL